jgi:nucleoside-diphosphate-sugar epimerase
MGPVLLTGATGFVGRSLCNQLADPSYSLRAAVRQAGDLTTPGLQVVPVGDICAHTDWGAALEGVRTVVHLAARAHRLNDTQEEPYFEVNARGTQQLARAAAQAGVRRFIYLSSIKVNGEGTDRTYCAADAPAPHDPYGRSKLLGEQHLWEICGASRMQGVVVRAPLVYGDGVKGNFLRLLHWARRGVPLPFGAIRNRRSLVSVWNLCDLLQLALEHPMAPGRVWLVSDGEDLSTPQLLRRISHAMGRRAWLPAVPPGVLAWLARRTGRGAEFARLTESLTVDAQPVRRELGWEAPLSATQGIERTVAWFLGRNARG